MIPYYDVKTLMLQHDRDEEKTDKEREEERNNEDKRKIQYISMQLIQ